MSSVSYLLNQQDLSASEIAIQFQDQEIQFTQVFDAEEQLIGQVLSEDLLDTNRTLFVFNLDSIQNILSALVGELIRNQLPVAVNSYNVSTMTKMKYHVMQDLRATVSKHHFGDKLKKAKVDAANTFMLINSEVDFELYLDKVLNSHSAGANIVVLKFLVLQQNKQVQISFVHVRESQLVLPVLQICEQVLCFRDVELDNYRRFLEASKVGFSKEEMGDYEMYLENSAAAADDDFRRVVQFCVTRSRCVFILANQGIQDDAIYKNLSFIRQTCALRPAVSKCQNRQINNKVNRFDVFQAANRLRSFGRHYLVVNGGAADVVDRNAMYGLAFSNFRGTKFQPAANKLDQVAVDYLETMEGKKLLSKEETAELDQLSESLMISRTLLGSSGAELKDSDVNTKIRYMNKLISRNDELIQKISSRLQHSESQLERAGEAEDESIRQGTAELLQILQPTDNQSVAIFLEQWKSQSEKMKMLEQQCLTHGIMELKREGISEKLAPRTQVEHINQLMKTFTQALESNTLESELKNIKNCQRSNVSMAGAFKILSQKEKDMKNAQQVMTDDTLSKRKQLKQLQVEIKELQKDFVAFSKLNLSKLAGSCVQPQILRLSECNKLDQVKQFIDESNLKKVQGSSSGIDTTVLKSLGAQLMTVFNNYAMSTQLNERQKQVFFKLQGAKGILKQIQAFRGAQISVDFQNKLSKLEQLLQQADSQFDFGFARLKTTVERFAHLASDTKQ